MDRLVAIILGILVIVAGFMVIRAIYDGTPDPDIVAGVECQFKGGTCSDICGGESISADCREGEVCCVEDRSRLT